MKQEPILDKIRAEIDEQYDRVHPYDILCAEGLEMALGIIDKYKADLEMATEALEQEEPAQMTREEWKEVGPIE